MEFHFSWMTLAMLEISRCPRNRRYSLFPSSFTESSIDVKAKRAFSVASASFRPFLS